MEDQPKLHDHLKALGEGGTTYGYGGKDQAPSGDVLESFPNPCKEEDEGAVTVDIIAPEFTCLCPKTGQPDFAAIEISYFPDKLCVESKSLKLYLMQYRMFGEFHEACVNRIGNDLVKLLDPNRLVITGKFTPRGGIKFWPVFHYQKEQKIVRGDPKVLGGR